MKTSGLICGQMVDFFFTSRGRDRFFEKLLYEVLETGGVGGDFWRSHLPEMNVVS